MVGMGRAPGRSRALGVESTDPVLSLLGALGLAQAAGTALVVDLCGDLTVQSDRTLAAISADGPSLQELSPGRAGVALVGSGGLEPTACHEVVEMLGQSWPAVVVRCGPGGWVGPIVPVRLLLPGLLQIRESMPAVWQPIGSGIQPPGPGPVLPKLRASLARRLLSGSTSPRSKWVRAWAPVWSLPWA